LIQKSVVFPTINPLSANDYPDTPPTVATTWSDSNFSASRPSQSPLSELDLMSESSFPNTSVHVSSTSSKHSAVNARGDYPVDNDQLMQSSFRETPLQKDSDIKITNLTPRHQKQSSLDTSSSGGPTQSVMKDQLQYYMKKHLGTSSP